MDTKKILSSFINSSIDRNAVAASEAIQSVLSHKVSQALNARKTELTGGLFKESVEETEEETEEFVEGNENE